MGNVVHVKVVARKDEPAERLIKRFMKKVRREGIMEEVRERMYYEKPSVKRSRQRRLRKKMFEKLKREN